MNGQHQLELGMESRDARGELVTASYVAEDGETESSDAEIVFNFSPSMGFVGNRCIVASTKSLARVLTDKGDAEVQTVDDNTRAELHANVLRDVLSDNRSQLVAQNMLEEGNSREEAESSIELLLQVLDYVEGASASLGTEDGRLKFKLSLEVGT